ncbi:MAG TPA: DUF493 domain-containing protein [Steroidobacteraceae bacterium]|nr:DUF493 domain-containing protein [Steroidobacteraceae bacterium]
MVEPPPLLRFPTDYPLKIVGRPSEEFRKRVRAIMLRHVPGLDPTRVSERLSENGNFLSISYVIVAESSDHVIGLIKDLKACEGVLTII